MAFYGLILYILYIKLLSIDGFSLSIKGQYIAYAIHRLFTERLYKTLHFK